MANTFPSRSMASSSVHRPQPVALACALSAVVVLADLTGPLLPDSEGNIVFGIVAALITSTAAAGLWMLRRWGFIASIVVAVLNLLQWAPAIVIATAPPVRVAAGLTVVACVLIIILVSRREARQTYH